ncbi:hypothetical protein ACMHYJ_02045 [Castellaniella hirudinis]|uniref:DUF7210 family protein n=1 Tax=Castellaniella hirudinis TaxID=1144617 RepID=UPI0039C02A4B
MKTIILDRPHTHAGKSYQPGARLQQVNDQSAAWLVERGIGHAASVPATPASKNPSKDNQENNRDG